MSTPHVSIAIYKGDPVDFQMYRHTLVFIEFSTESSLIVHIVGSRGEYSLDTRSNEDPTAIKDFIKKIAVGYTSNAVTEAQITQLAYSNPPNNRDLEMNCQTWVGQFLGAMQSRGWLAEGDVSRGLDGMAEVILEAEDEP